VEEIIAAIIGAAISGGITWYATKSQIGQQNELLEGQLRDSNKDINQINGKLKEASSKISDLFPYKEKYLRVKHNLEKSSVVRRYFQPVILVGPRAVGKTSLVTQWHAPWDRSRLSPTQTVRTSAVPVFDFQLESLEPNFADSEILSKIHMHLSLRVHDFPGELGAQKSVIEKVVEETLQIRGETEKDLGVVLICMLDASEALTQVSRSTVEYYNGELFANLRALVSHNKVSVERIVFVFNKYDLLKAQRVGVNDVQLMKACLQAYQNVITPLRGICNPERFCEVFTVLDRDDMVMNNRGAPIVLGEASRRFVEALAGKEHLQNVVKEAATNYITNLF